MKAMWTIAIAAALSANPALAADTPAPSPADDAQIDKLIGPFLAGLKSGKAKDVIAN